MSSKRKTDYKKTIAQQLNLHDHHKDVYFAMIEQIWHNHSPHEELKWLEKYLILVVLWLKMLMPSFWIRHYSEQCDSTRGLFDLYIIMKPLLFLIFMHFERHLYPLIMALIIYLLLDLILYIIWLVILHDLFTKPISIRKNIILLWANYMEIVMGFALLYLHRDAIDFIGYKKEWIIWPIDAIYYSMSTFSTVWYGDIASSSQIGMLLTMTQLFISIMFIGVVMSWFVSQLHLKDE